MAFSFKKPDLLTRWIKFVNCKNWKPSKNSIICAKHFKDELIKDGKRKKLKWELLSVPTIHTEKALKHHSVLPCASIICKAPKIRLFQKDKLGNFVNDHIIKSFNNLTSKNASPGYLCHQTKDYIIYYKILFNEKVAFLLFRKQLKLVMTCTCISKFKEIQCLFHSGLLMEEMQF